MLLACASEYRAKVEAAGLLFRPVRPSFGDLERALGMNRAQLTDAVLDRGDFLLRRVIMPHVRESYEDMLDLLDGADLVLTSSLAFGARLAAERREVPWVAIVLQPLMFLSAFDPPEIPGAAWLSRLLRRWGPRPTAWAMRLVKFAVGRQLGAYHALRREIGLPPAALNPLFEGQFSELGAIGLYPALLGAAQDDHPRPTVIAGFPCFDSEDGAPASLDRALEQFLAAGSAPLVFTLGSLIVNSPGAFYEVSLAAARLLGMRAILLVGEEALAGYSAAAGAHLHVCAYAPHSLLFPWAAVVVHQGGIGTLGQALRSGRPQLIVPHYADQTDNAARAVRLGVARSLLPARYALDKVSRELELLLGAPQYAASARRVGGVLAGQDGAAEAAAIVWDALESRFTP